MRAARSSSVQGLVYVALFLSGFAGPARAASPSAATLTSTAITPPPPYGQEDVPALESALERAEQSFEQVMTKWRDGMGATPQTVQTAEGEVQRLKAELEKAKTAPVRALVVKRLAYDAEVGVVVRSHERLASTGTISLALEDARAGLADLVSARTTLATIAEEPSFILDRLSAAEKLDDQLRVAEEQLAVAQRLHEQLEKSILDRYDEFETNVVVALRAYRRLKKLWSEFALSSRAVAYGGGALSPSQIAAQHIFSESADSPGIYRLWLQHGGDARPELASSVRKYSGQLAKYQKDIEQRRFLRDRLVSDVERLRIGEIENHRAQDNAEASAVIIPPTDREYARLAAQIRVRQGRLTSLLSEHDRFNAEVEEIRAALSKQREQESAQREALRKREELLSRRRSNPTVRFPSVRGAPQWRAQTIGDFVLAQKIASDREHLESLGRAIRRTEVSLDVLNRRVRANEREQAQIEDRELPALRTEYYATIGETFAARGLRALLVLFFAYLVLRFIRRGSGSLIESIVETTLIRQGVEAIREQRARTLMSVFAGAVRFSIYVLAGLFVVSQLDIDYGPLLVAAGGVSLAVGFGAQALVKDFFAGFFILLEGQYSIGDVVEINDKTGTVEDLNLRTTILRSVDGNVHTIPNGEITITTNKTKYWSRAVVDIDVGYKEDIDAIIGVLNRVVHDLREHEHWADKLRESEVLGVETFGDSAVSLRVLLKTSPGKQWAVSREFKRRVKLAFDELGIEIPWPQRVVTQKTDALDAQGSRAKQRAIRRYIGQSVEDTIDNAPPIPVEDRDRVEALANKEAAIRQKELGETEVSDELDPPTHPPRARSHTRPPE